MRKRIYIFLLLIAVFCGLYWFFIVKKNAVNNNIPNYADAIICIDKHNIRNSILGYYLSSPSEYFSKKDSTKSSFENIGIEIPNYLVLFSANTITKGTFLTELKLIDKQLLVDFLISNDFYKTTKNNYEIYERGGKVKIKVYFKEEVNSVVLAGNIIDFNAIKVVDDLFNETNLLFKDDELYSKLKSSSNHITTIINESKYVKKQSFITVNFLKGKVEVKGEVFNRDEYEFKGKSDLVSNSSNLLNLSANIEGLFFNELIESVNKIDFNKKTNLNLDSLTNYFNPSMNFNLQDIITTYDTAVSYSYDDNFNAIEEELITSRQTAQFNLEIDKKEKGAFNYFINDSTIKRIDSNYIFIPYPLQQIFVNENDKQISFHTNIISEKDERTKSNNFIDVTANLSSINKAKDLKSIKLHLTQKQSVEIKGELLFQNEETHAIFGVLNMFKQ